LLGEDTSLAYSLILTNVAAGTYSLSARIVYDSGSLINSTPANITVIGLAAPWQLKEIGNPGLPGSAQTSNGLYTLNSDGDISTLADSFSFVYQSLSAMAILRSVSSVQNVSSNSAVGVMIRETLASDSKYVFTGISGLYNFLWQSRSVTGGKPAFTN